MLKITVYDRPTSGRLQLEGKLAGAWITAVENTSCSAPQRDSGKHLEIELTDVTSVGEVGKHLLTLMHRVGAHFIAAGVVMKALIQEITGETTGTLSRGQRSWKRVRNLVCLLALLIIVHDVSLLAEDVPAAPIRLTLKDAVTLGAETKSLYDAGYGRNPGVNVITQSGTNVFRVLPTGWLPCAEADATGLFTNARNRKPGKMISSMLQT